MPAALTRLGAALLPLLAAVALIAPTAATQAATPTSAPQPMPTPVLPPDVTPVPSSPGANKHVASSGTHMIGTLVPPLRDRFKPKDGDRIRYVRPGVLHLSRVTEDPLRINVLLFDLTAPQFDIRTGLNNDWLSGRAPTSRLVAQNDALAGVNGDLFSSDGIPQGLTMVDSKVAVAPKYRATFAWHRDRKPFIGYFTKQWTWLARVVATNGQEMPIQLLNWPCQEDWICLFNEFAKVVPEQFDDVKVLVGPNGKVFNIIEGEAVRIRPGVQVVHATGTGAAWLLRNMSVGDTIKIETKTTPPLDDFTQAISGGPIILKQGKFVQDCLCLLNDCSTAQLRGPTEIGDLFGLSIFNGPQCEDFDFDWKVSHYLWTQMPRTGIGYDKDRTLLVVAVVDGYQPGFSRGMTQKEFAALFKEFGVSEAMELDGGGSATMVLEDTVVNNPSDDTGERFVANSLLFLWREPTLPPSLARPAGEE